MKLEKIFKGLILSQVIMHIWLIPEAIFFAAPDIPQELQYQYVLKMEESFLSLISWIWLCLFYPSFFWITWKISKFHSYGRKCYLIYFLCLIPLSLLWGNRIHTPLDAIGDIDDVIMGFMIALMYFSPLKEKFAEERNIV